ncbi:MAG: sodium:solute symporter family transporter [Rubripirellula sp.]
MAALDYLIVLIYLVGLFLISTFAAKRNTGQKEMFSANRSSPWWASGLSGFMTVFSANTFVVWGGIAYQFGLVAVVINLTYGVAALLIGYSVAGRWNQMGLDTPAEYVAIRFGNRGLSFFTITLLIKRILGVSGSLYALGVLLTATTSSGSAILPFTLDQAILLFGAIIILYTMQGGLWAVLMTDVLQFIVLTVVVLVASILMLADIGSLENFRTNTPEDFLNFTAGDYTWFFLLGWTIINFFTFGAEWAFVQRFLAVKNPRDARKATYLFGLMYLVTPLFWMLPPLLYRSQVQGAQKESAYIMATESVLPAGLVGLMVAALFSATASMVSSQLNVFAGVLTNDFYRTFFDPAASEKKLVRVGRVFTLLLGAVLVVIALLVPAMGGAEKLVITINSMLVVPLLAPTLWGLFSRKLAFRHLVYVTLISFTLGMTLRFGLPLLIDQESRFGWITDWVTKNQKMVELFVGVLLPVCLLAAFEFFLQRIDHRAQRLMKKCSEVAKEIGGSQKPATLDLYPVRMVAISLFVLGVWLLLIGFRESSVRTIMLITGMILVFLSLGLEFLVRRLKNR